MTAVLETTASITHPQGRERVEIVRRADGLFEIIEANYIPAYQEGPYSGDGYWASGPNRFGLYETTESALQDARRLVSWLSETA
jgi:hypothetical protein